MNVLFARLHRATRVLAVLSIGMAALVTAAPASAEISGAWTLGTNTANTNAGLNGIVATVSGATGNAYENNNIATAPPNYWTTAYSGAVPGNPSLQLTLGFPNAGTVRTLTMTFSEPVDNPILQLDRFGGQSGGVSNSSSWTMTNSVSQGGAVTLTRLSGNAQFTLTGTTFQRTPNQTAQVGGTECASATNSTACGSIRFNGTGITSLTFSIAIVGPTGDDAIELAWSLTGSKVLYRKQSLGGTGSFSLGGTNGVGATTLDTTTANPTAVSSQYTVANHTQAITITEPTVPAGYTLSAASSCIDQNGVAVASTVNAGTRTLSIAPAAYGGNQTITCTLVNVNNADLSITKTNAGTSVVSGSTTTYTIVASNAGPGTVANPVVRDNATSGLSNCAVVAGSCTTTGTATCPAPGVLTYANLSSAGGVQIPSLAANSSVQFQVSCTVD